LHFIIVVFYSYVQIKGSYFLSTLLMRTQLDDNQSLKVRMAKVQFRPKTVSEPNQTVF